MNISVITHEPALIFFRSPQNRKDRPVRSPAATPALTSIHQPSEEVCQAALTLLFNQLYGKNTPYKKIVPATLTVRKSCAVPVKQI